MTTVIQTEDLLPLEAILPEQFVGLWTRRPRSPEFALALAVIEQAAVDLRNHRHARERRAQRLYRDAYRWVSSSDRDYPFSFLNLCDAVGLSPEALRFSLLNERVSKAAA